MQAHLQSVYNKGKVTSQSASIFVMNHEGVLLARFPVEDKITQWPEINDKVQTFDRQTWFWQRP